MTSRDAVPNEVRRDAVPSEARDASLSLGRTKERLLGRTK
jgi:ABC-type phosphate transport system permease subunit